MCALCQPISPHQPSRHRREFCALAKPRDDAGVMIGDIGLFGGQFATNTHLALANHVRMPSAATSHLADAQG